MRTSASRFRSPPGWAAAAATPRPRSPAFGRLWDLEQAVPDLQPLAAALGSDVSFFLSGGTAIAEGRGDVITPLPALPRTHLVLLAPQVEIPNKTRYMYSRLTPESYTNGERSAYLRAGLERSERPDLDTLFNVFEHVAFGLDLPSRRAAAPCWKRARSG